MTHKITVVPDFYILQSRVQIAHDTLHASLYFFTSQQKYVNLRFTA